MILSLLKAKSMEDFSFDFTIATTSFLSTFSMDVIVVFWVFRKCSISSKNVFGGLVSSGFFSCLDSPFFSSLF